MQKDSGESPLPWQWMLSIERRLTRLETKARERGREITPGTDPSQTWTPRDWMLACAGLSMLLATVSEKIGWTTFCAAMVKLYGGR